ncbi:MAG TPA: YbaK/EbsC family protein [Marmoricola sp.]|nr:YbaK/EbsC family protein [Marmoricola sp.]
MSTHEPASRDADEPVALVDGQGRVTGTAARSDVRRDNLRHAATAVLVRRPDGEILLHRRTATKDWAPGLWDAAAGGVLRAGEEPDTSAARELAEELGITGVALRPLTTHLFEDTTTRCFEHAYEAVWDGPVTLQPEEVAEGRWASMTDLVALLEDQPARFVPDTAQLLRRLAAAGIGDYGQLRAIAAARRAGLPFTVTRHGPVRSLEEAAAARGLAPQQVLKTLVVRLAEDDFRFVLVPGGREIAWPRLRALLGVNRLSMPSAAVAREVTGYERGTITPLGADRAWPVVADAAVARQVSIGGGAHGVALTVDAADLLAALGAVSAEVTAEVEDVVDDGQAVTDADAGGAATRRRR